MATEISRSGDCGCRQAGRVILTFIKTLVLWVVHSQVLSVAGLVTAGMGIREEEEG